MQWYRKIYKKIYTWSPLQYTLLSCALLAIVALVELWLGRVGICTCGYIKLWEGVVNGPGNSQHIADWYTFSHLIHGFIFYGLLTLAFPKMPVGARLLLAIGIEGAWELLENSPLIINRYRSETISLGYNGDSVLNSISDILAMILGFFMARKWPVMLIIALALTFELFTAYTIRDNLTLNIIMLVHPTEAIKQWQLGLP